MGIFRRKTSGPSSGVAIAPTHPSNLPGSGGTAGVASPWSTGALHSVVWADLVGVEHLPITRAEAMAVGAMARSRHIIAGSIARMPLRAWRGGDVLPDANQPGWLTNAGGLPAFHRMLWTIDDLIFGPWSLWRVGRYADGSGLAWAMRVPLDEWRINSDNTIDLSESGSWRPAKASEVVLIPGPHEGVLTYGASDLRTAALLGKAAARVAENPAVYTELHQTEGDPLNKDDRVAMLKEWRYARTEAGGGVGYTSPNIEIRTHGSPAEHLLIEGRNAAAVEVARHVSLPASALDATTAKASLNYENRQGRNADVTDYGLALYMAAVSARLSMDDVVPHGQTIRFDAEDWLSVLPGQETATPTPDVRQAQPGATPQEPAA